jgi:hypothetical protein
MSAILGEAETIVNSGRRVSRSTGRICRKAPPFSAERVTSACADFKEAVNSGSMSHRFILLRGRSSLVVLAIACSHRPHLQGAANAFVQKSIGCSKR